MATDDKIVEIKLEVDTSDVDKAMKNVVKSADKMAKDVEKAGDKAEDSFEDLGEQLKDVTKEMKNLAKNINLNALTSSVNKAMNQVKKTVDKTVTDIKKQFQNAFSIKGDVQVNVTGGSSEDAQGAVSDATSLIGQAMTSGAMGSNIQKNLAETGEIMEDTMEGVEESIHSSMNDIGKNMKDTMTDTTKTIEESFATTRNNLKEMFSNLNLGEQIEIDLQNTMNSVTESIRKAIDLESIFGGEEIFDLGSPIDFVVEKIDTLEKEIAFFNKQNINLDRLDGLKKKLNEFQQAKVVLNLDQPLEELERLFDKFNKAPSRLNAGNIITVFRNIQKELQGVGFDTATTGIDNLFEEWHKVLSSGSKVTNTLKIGMSDLRQQLTLLSTATRENIGEQLDLAKTSREQAQAIKQAENQIDNQVKSHSRLESAMNGVKKVINNVRNSFNDLEDGYKATTKAQDKMTKSTKKTESAFKSLAKSLAPYLGLAAVFGTIKTSISDALEAGEAGSMFDTVFGSSAEDMNKWISDMNKTLGLGITDTKKYTATIMQMGKAMEMTNEDAMSMAQSMAKMAGDISSFYDTDITQAQEDLRSALSGSMETMDKYGIILRENTLKEFAYKNGIAAVGEELTNAQKAMATTLFIENALGVANGDLARTINSPANQLRILNANLKDVRTALGNCFTPILTVVLPILNQFVSALASVINKVADFISKLFYLFGVETGGGGIFSEVAESAEGIGTALADGLEKATGGASDVADTLKEGAKSAKEIMKELMGIDEINNLTPKDSTGGSGGSGDSGSGGGAGSELGDSLGGLADETEQASDKVKDGIGEIADWIYLLRDNLKMVWNALKEGFLSVSDYINTSIANLKQSIANLGTSIQAFLLGVWNNGGEQLVYNFGRLGGAITGLVIDITGQCIQMVADLFAYMNPDTNPYTQMFLTGLNNLLVACQDFALSVGGWFQTFLDNGGQAFLNVMGDIFSLLGSIFTQLLADAINALTNFFNSWLGYTIISTVAIALDLVAGAIKAVLIIIRECLPLVEALAGAFGLFALLKVKNDFTQLFSILKKGHGDVKETKDLMKQLETTMGGKLATKIDNLKLKVINLKDSFKKFTKDGLKNVGKEFDNCKKSMSKFGDDIKKVGKSALDFFNNIGKGAIKLVTFSSAQAAGATTATAMATAEGAATVATTGLTVATTALGIALAALGIGLIIAAIAGIIAVIRNWETITTKVKDACTKAFDAIKKAVQPVWDALKKVFQPIIDFYVNYWTTVFKAFGQLFKPLIDGAKAAFDWLKEKFSWLGDTCKWIGDQFSWAWDKLKGFFGAKDVENNIEPEAEQTEESISGLGDTIEETSDRFGTACSAINEALNSIGIDGNRIALQLDEAEASFNEKFSMMSKKSQEYLQAIADGNEEVMNQMAGDADACMADIIYTFNNMSVQEQALWYATYGEIEGVTDGWLDYTTGSYDECLAKHSGMMLAIKNNELIGSEEKTRLMNEEVESFKKAMDSRENYLEGKINEINAMEWQSEEDRYNAVKQYSDELDLLRAQMTENEIGYINDAEDAVLKSTELQEGAYDGVADSQTEALEGVDKSLETTKGNLSSFKEESDKVAKEIPKEWEGIGETISDEFEGALDGIKTNFTGILNNTQKQCNQLKSGLQATFNDVKTGVKKSMDEVNKTIKTKFTEAVNSVKTAGNNLKTSLQSIFQNISSGLTTSFTNIKNSMTNAFKSMSTSITSTMNSCKNTITNTLNSINTQVKSKTTAIKNTVSTTFNSLAKTFTSPFTTASKTITDSLTTMNTTIGSRLKTIVSTLQSYATKMKNTMNFNFPTPYLRMPHISVYGDWNFEKKTVPSFRVNWWSSGAIFNKRTILGNMGVGDAQNGYGNNPEAVLPLDSLWKELNVQFQKQNQALKNNNQPIQVNLYLDGKVVTSTVIDNMKDQSKRGVLDTSWL